MPGQHIRVTGVVQGVGFRPFVWRLARECGIDGSVCNDAGGVSIQAWGSCESLAHFARCLQTEPPPLARIEAVECTVLDAAPPAESAFRITGSRTGKVRTGVAADAATCCECLAEVLNPADRRYRYPFTNCTHCGPRLSIVRAIPYDRANTSMAAFDMCPACQAEYEDPANRRFHAQPNACPVCGPRLWLEDGQGQPLTLAPGCDAVETAARLIRQGQIVAIKGLGGIHLACDAGNEAAVARLRQRKQRYAKALALMARDLEMVRRYAEVSAGEAALLENPAAPIVVLDAGGEPLATGVAPGQTGLGFMLPYTPLHHLLLRSLERPVVMTSGNRSDEPQAIANDEARQRLGPIADAWLLHDREILNRLDDSVLRIAAGQPRFLRRARGYAPEAIRLPRGFESSGSILAMGGELKSTFCLLQAGQARLSPHIGDLEEATTLRDYRHALTLYRRLFDFRPTRVVVDGHPDYHSTALGQALARDEAIPLDSVQHHHAHIAACLADNDIPLDAGPILGVALDGLGLGEDGTLWGGEFLRADYTGFERLAHFQPVPLPGGVQAMREPWRNTFAQIHHALGWERVNSDYAGLDIVRFLDGKPLASLKVMVDRGLNSPMSSSCGRLFDAVAAAIGVCRERALHEGQAAIELESLAMTEFHRQVSRGYPASFDEGRVLSWRPLWTALLDDLGRGTAAAVIAARFHQGLARAIAGAAETLCAEHGLDTVALGGGVFQNCLLLEGIDERLRKAGLRVLIPRKVPANDGGLSLGQAAIGAARSIG